MHSNTRFPCVWKNMVSSCRACSKLRDLYNFGSITQIFCYILGIVPNIVLKGIHYSMPTDRSWWAQRHVAAEPCNISIPWTCSGGHDVTVDSCVFSKTLSWHRFIHKGGPLHVKIRPTIETPLQVAKESAIFQPKLRQNCAQIVQNEGKLHDFS